MIHLARIKEIRAAIVEISERLKRPMSNTERYLLVADRKDLRAKLSKLEAEEAE